MSQLLDPGLFDLTQRQIDQAEFHQRIHEGIGSELCTAADFPFDTLHFLINDTKLFRMIEEITRCGRVGCFEGRVYRMIPGCNHYDSWHDDLSHDRIVGMSINLSTDIYSGGIFQLRERNSEEILYQVANVGFGDGIIFRLAHHLEHRITNVDGPASKTAFAGWFRSLPDFRSLWRSRLGELG